MDKTIINKILITLVFLFAYRILAYVPIPGVDVDVIKRFFDSKETLDHQYEWDKECHEHQPLPFGIPQFDQVSEIYGDV